MNSCRSEIYELPIIITEKDLEIEKMYLDYYNEEYWEKYKLEKRKEITYEYNRICSNNF